MNKISCCAFYVCVSLLAVVNGIITVRPQNTATSVGGQTFFNCSTNTNNEIAWLYSNECDITSGTQITVSDCIIDSNYASHYGTEKPGPSTCNLIVFNATMSLGRCHICFEFGVPSGGILQAMLIVVDSNAIVTTNSTELIPGEVVVISSNVSYGGPSIPLIGIPVPLPPSFYWTLLLDQSRNITSYPGSTTNTSASSYIIVPVELPDVPQHELHLFFNQPPTVPSCATNAPSYRTSYVTPPYPVSYAPKDISIFGVPSECTSVGTEPITLMCNASGFPPPTYKWFEVANPGQVLFSGSEYPIHTDGTYQCNASNTIKGMEYSISTVANVSGCLPLSTVPPPKEPCDIACIIILVIVIFFGLNLLFFIIFMICYGCSENGRDTMNDKFPWLKKMLPCMNKEGCKCSVWILYFVLLSIFTGFVFFPTIMIMASCCKNKKKTSQVNNTQLSDRNGRGGGNTQLHTLGTPPYPPRMSVTPNPPSTLDSTDHYQQDPRINRYPPSITQQRQSGYSDYSDPYQQNPRPNYPPRQTPSPALSAGGIVYAELGVDNQPKSRRPIQPLQPDGSSYASIALA